MGYELTQNSQLRTHNRDNLFDFLKKKISGFINKITGKEELKEEKEIPAPTVEEIKETPVQPIEEKIEQSAQLEEKKPEAIVKPEVKEEIKEEKIEEKPKIEELKLKEEKIPEQKKEEPKPLEKKIERLPEKRIEKPPEIKPEKVKREIEKKSEVVIQPKTIEPKIEKEVETKPVIEIERKIEQKPLPPITKEEKPKEKEVKIGLLGHLKSIFTGEIEIGKNDVREMLDSLELELIESDVAMEVAEIIKQELEEKLVGKKIKKSELNNFIKNAIKESLLNIISNDKIFDVVDIIKTYQKPVKILFLGTNGSGKTTTIAKIAKMLMQNGNKVVLAAADTFRAAAIEQLATHAERLEIKIIKREYGSDPTAVAYDAINYANAHSIDVVLIDTAGRQETNFNLLNEMKKMQRVIQPNLKIYIGESIAGNAIISQVSEFNKGIGVDAVILTKLDCDAKGGTVLSISKVTGIPIIYLGTGQRYEDLEKFDAHAIVDRILS
ncbi:signal recognition particle-docking protein FtsY [Candidatus Micrarchaeota archaeon]|nr:signal recognition particle-docking protein FtsY [Candidatus Micrarchaeota archaeon]